MDEPLPLETCILVLGLGNVLRQDEGLGPQALERLRAGHVFPPQVRLLEGGTLGLDLLPYLDGVTHLLILDAVEMGQPGGSLVRLDGDEIMAGLAQKLSVHQVGLPELLALAGLQGNLPPNRVLLGLQPAALDWGTELSEPVAAALDDLVAAAVAQLNRWSATP